MAAFGAVFASKKQGYENYKIAKRIQQEKMKRTFEVFEELNIQPEYIDKCLYKYKCFYISTKNGIFSKDMKDLNGSRPWMNCGSRHINELKHCLKLLEE